MANDSRGQHRKRHRASSSSASLRAYSTSVEARKNGSLSTRRASVSSGSVMFPSRSLHTFLQTILDTFDLSPLLCYGQMRDAKDARVHRMAPFPLSHLFPNAPLYVGQLLPNGVRRSLSLSGFFNLQGQRRIIVPPKILPILRRLFDNIPVPAILLMASFSAQQILK